MRLADLDAVTLDAFGTLLTLDDPIGKLAALLPDFERDAIEAAFRVEGAYYTSRSHLARDEPELQRLRDECAAVFNDALGSELSSDEYNGVFDFVVIEGVEDALLRLRSYGLALAVVTDWDLSLPGHLERTGLDHWFDAVVTSAETGVRKPEPAAFGLALERLGVQPGRALHVGDTELDADGARAAGMHFLPAPVVDAVAALR